MGLGERRHLVHPQVAQLESDHPLVGLVTDALDQPGGDGSIDEFDDAVVAEQQVIGDVADRRLLVVAADGQQELVLRTSEPNCIRLVIAPPQEPAKAVAECEQPVEIGIGKGPAGSPGHIAPR